LLFIVFVYKKGDKITYTTERGFPLREKNRNQQKRTRKEHSDRNVFHPKKRKTDSFMMARHFAIFRLDEKLLVAEIFASLLLGRKYTRLQCSKCANFLPLYMSTGVAVVARACNTLGVTALINH
jgi:hypothetical protein